MNGRAALPVPVWCAVVALVVNGLAVLVTLSVADWRPSVLVRMAASEPIALLAREAAPSFAFVAPAAHYDGVYYYAIAWDPLARGPAHLLIDRAAYRYGHPGYGWLAHLLSPGVGMIPTALLAVNLAAAAIGPWAFAVLARRLGCSPWLGLGAALNPGIIYAVTVDTSEALSAAVLALGLLAYLGRRWLRAAALLGYLPLIKEPFVLVPFSLGAWEVVEALRGRRAPDWRRRAATLAPAVIPFALWQTYLRLQFGVWSFSGGTGNFTVPFEGWIMTLQRAAMMGSRGSFDQMQLGQAEVALLMATAGLLAVGIARALRFKSPIDAIYPPFGAMLFGMTWIMLLYPKDLLRMLVVPLVLLPFVLAGRHDPAG